MFATETNSLSGESVDLKHLFPIIIYSMRVAVFWDIHGNCMALDAVLADLKDKAPDRMVCLGDAIQSGPQPAQVVQRLRDLACQVVMGNADAWLLWTFTKFSTCLKMAKVQSAKVSVNVRSQGKECSDGNENNGSCRHAQVP